MHMSGVAPVNETLTRELSGVCKACFTSEGGAKKGGVQIEVGRGARVERCILNRRTAQPSPDWAPLPSFHTSYPKPLNSALPSNSQPHVREAFVRDLNPDAPTFPPTLGELTQRLKAWRNKLQARARALCCGDLLPVVVLWRPAGCPRLKPVCA